MNAHKQPKNNLTMNEKIQPNYENLSEALIEIMEVENNRRIEWNELIQQQRMERNMQLDLFTNLLVKNSIE
jgi:hypothetical protein